MNLGVVHFCVQVFQFFQGKHLGGWVFCHKVSERIINKKKNPSTKKSIYFCKKKSLNAKLLYQMIASKLMKVTVNLILNKKWYIPSWHGPDYPPVVVIVVDRTVRTVLLL